MMNPTSIAYDLAMNPNLPSPQTMNPIAPQISPPFVAQQTIAFSLIFNRQFEVWQGVNAAGGQDFGPSGGGPGPAALGVRWDIRALERLMGMFDAVAPNHMGIGVNDVGSNPPYSLPVQVAFGGPNSLQFQGYITALDYTYTMFSVDMIPVECSVDVTIMRMYLPEHSNADLVNPLITQGPGAAVFPFSPTSTWNPTSGIVQINRKGGISL
jgi:hypothetical protein